MELPFALCHNRARMITSFPKERNYSSSHTTTSCRASKLSMRKMTNFYKVLELDSENVGIDKIKRAYRSMALRYHPDVCPPSEREESTRVFVELCSAYETLSDPIMRARHDRQLGLVGSGDREGIKGMRRDEEGRRRFMKEVWMNQINELGARSAKRMAKKRMEWP